MKRESLCFGHTHQLPQADRCCVGLCTCHQNVFSRRLVKPTVSFDHHSALFPADPRVGAGISTALAEQHKMPVFASEISFWFKTSGACVCLCPNKREMARERDMHTRNRIKTGAGVWHRTVDHGRGASMGTTLIMSTPDTWGKYECMRASVRWRIEYEIEVLKIDPAVVCKKWEWAIIVYTGSGSIQERWFWLMWWYVVKMPIYYINEVKHLASTSLRPTHTTTALLSATTSSQEMPIFPLLCQSLQSLFTLLTSTSALQTFQFSHVHFTIHK